MLKLCKQILAINNPARVLNCDESGFSLCPKFGKVLASCGAKVVYYTILQSFKNSISVFFKRKYHCQCFQESRHYAPNRTAIDEQKLLPSQISMPTNGETLTTEQSIAKQLTLTTLEGLSEDPMKQFKVQFHEGYDLEEDILYNTWKVLKEKSTCLPLSDLTNNNTEYRRAQQ